VAKSHLFGRRESVLASVTGARTSRRTPTYSAAETAKTGSDCGAAPGVARNRPNKGASGRASRGALKRSRRDGGAGRR
jgi:hypothetical protein